MSIPDPIVLLDARARYVHPAFRTTRASTKTVFDAAGRLVTVPVNAIGWDHDPRTGYLSEPQTTCFLRRANDWADATWVKAEVTIDPGADPGIGAGGLAKMVETSAESLHEVRQTIAVGGGAHTLSVVAKAAERYVIRLAAVDVAAPSNNIIMQANLLSLSTSSWANGDGVVLGVEAKPLPLRDDLVRVVLSGALSSVPASWRVSVSLINENPSYTGDGSSGAYVGYAQLEPGVQATSWNDTLDDVVVRSPDALTLPQIGALPWWSSERGTLLVEADVIGATSAHADSAAVVFMLTSDLRVRFLGTGALAVTGSIAAQNLVLLGSELSRGRHIVALSWDRGSVAGVADGRSVMVGDLVGNLPASPSLRIASNPVNPTQTLRGRIYRAVYYPQRLSNADLQSLTAIQE